MGLTAGKVINYSKADLEAGRIGKMTWSKAGLLLVFLLFLSACGYKPSYLAREKNLLDQGATVILASHLGRLQLWPPRGT